MSRSIAKGSCASESVAEAPQHPSLFGRFTAVMQGHAQLGHTLRDLREMSQVLAQGRANLPAELGPVALLAALRSELEEHFAMEEAEGYFGTIALERTDLSGAVASLIAEHAKLLEKLGRLEVHARDAAAHPQLATLTLALLEDLAKHERSESSVMAEYLALG
jgi:iron-sulfur cluster repair protein YtfE (RIC family)